LEAERLEGWGDLWAAICSTQLVVIAGGDGEENSRAIVGK